MRAGIVRDRLEPALLAELPQDDPASRVPAAGRELAVAPRFRAAFAEEVVALGIENAVLVQVANPGGARVHRVAAFENDGLEPASREEERREQARWPRTDHDRRSLEDLA